MQEDTSLSIFSTRVFVSHNKNIKVAEDFYFDKLKDTTVPPVKYVLAVCHLKNNGYNLASLWKVINPVSFAKKCT